MTTKLSGPVLGAVPPSWPLSPESEGLWTRVRQAPRSVLMLDYDGTLAPFTKDRLQAFPYPGVEERLARLSRLQRVRLALVSGRAARELENLLNSLPVELARVELWGNHGRERLQADGAYQFETLSAAEKTTLEQVEWEIGRLGFSEAIERKPGSLAIHWRGFAPETQEQIGAMVRSLTARCVSGLDLLPFDGGLELRSTEHTKGSAVAQILAEEEPATPSAYLGDDLTDEDAFVALKNRGIGILVRPEPRESFAKFWIQPPHGLLQFLDDWIRASTTESGR